MGSDSISKVKDEAVWSVGAEVGGNLGGSGQQRQSLGVPQFQSCVGEECDTDLDPKKETSNLNIGNTVKSSPNITYWPDL
jgi:hypothetical protein